MDVNFVKALWERGEGKYAFISFKTPEGWEDHPVGAGILNALQQPQGWDVFFSPLTFSEPRRLAKYAEAPSILYADLDPVDPETLDPAPHLAWETSAGSYQAVWLLEEPITYLTKWTDLNRRMTYHTGADKGGWSPSKVLRVPGSINYKYTPPQGGRMVIADWGEGYSIEYLEDKLPPLTSFKEAEDEEAPPIITDHDALNEMWQRMPPRIQHYLTKSNVGDRSRMIVSTAHKMREAGVSREDAYHMLWYAPYCKWRFRSNPDRLWTEVVQVYQK